MVASRVFGRDSLFLRDELVLVPEAAVDEEVDGGYVVCYHGRCAMDLGPAGGKDISFCMLLLKNLMALSKSNSNNQVAISSFLGGVDIVYPETYTMQAQTGSNKNATPPRNCTKNKHAHPLSPNTYQSTASPRLILNCISACSRSMVLIIGMSWLRSWSSSRMSSRSGAPWKF